MSLHDELRAEVARLQMAVHLSLGIDEDDERTDAHYEYGRGNKAAEVLLSLSAILARHPEPAVSGPTAEQVLTIAEGLRKRFAVSNGTQVWVEFQGSVESLADEIADIFAQLQVQAPVGEGLENGVSDGEREALENLLSDEFVKDSAGFGSCNLPRTIADALIAAGYRKPTLPSVEDVARVLFNAEKGHGLALDATYDSALHVDQGLRRRMAREVLAAIKAHMLDGGDRG